MINNPILSLCIPTNGVVEYVIPLIESIYSQGIDTNIFEVVITDNGKDSCLEKSLNIHEYPNLFYYKTSSNGFTNQIDSFRLSHGEFRKMLNHRDRMIPGSLQQLISLIKEYINTRPIIYCAGNNNKNIACNSIDSFVAHLKCTVSWSAGVGIWKEDIPALEKAEINTLFPHIALLFGIRKNPKFLIYGTPYAYQCSASGKGGYNPFYAFGVEFLDIINRLRLNRLVSDKTFLLTKQSVYKRLKYFYLEDYLLDRANNTYNFDNIKDVIKIYYDTFTFYKIKCWSWKEYPKYKLVRLFKY